ncbi:hypothetical protein DV096_11885 [Bradymonadaceae bacterium TMQ3]|nr:hypothetical protein DV096_11885 [Bradymonadaceae bacterium TMQ3]
MRVVGRFHTRRIDPLRRVLVGGVFAVGVLHLGVEMLEELRHQIFEIDEKRKGGEDGDLDMLAGGAQIEARAGRGEGHALKVQGLAGDQRPFDAPGVGVGADEQAALGGGHKMLTRVVGAVRDHAAQSEAQRDEHDERRGVEAPQAGDKIEDHRGQKA